MKKYILKIVMLSISMILLYITNSYGAENGTVRMQINGGTPWTNINISESYEECEALNSATSTLGTSALKAHLTTDADWSAMAIFSVSQYGETTSNEPKQTNGNVSGIYDVGGYYTQSTGILNIANSNSNPYLSGLFKEDGSVKKYMRQWSTNREETGFVGFNETFSWHGGDAVWGANEYTPISIKHGVFGVYFGNGGIYARGGPFSNVTFRPVIWN